MYAPYEVIPIIIYLLCIDFELQVAECGLKNFLKTVRIDNSIRLLCETSFSLKAKLKEFLNKLRFHDISFDLELAGGVCLHGRKLTVH